MLSTSPQTDDADTVAHGSNVVDGRFHGEVKVQGGDEGDGGSGVAAAAAHGAKVVDEAAAREEGTAKDGIGNAELPILPRLPTCVRTLAHK